MLSEVGRIFMRMNIQGVDNKRDRGRGSADGGRSPSALKFRTKFLKSGTIRTSKFLTRPRTHKNTPTRRFNRLPIRIHYDKRKNARNGNFDAFRTI